MPDKITPTSDLSNETTSDDILDTLSEETEAPAPEPEDDDDDDEENKKSSEDDDEEESDGGEEKVKFELDEDEPLMAPASRKKILEKYPKLFKDFPWLEHAHYRNNKYSEIFPTVEDAQEAAGAVEQLSNIQSALSSGNTEGLIKYVKNSDPEAFNRLVDNYLNNLGKVDKEAYYHVVGNITKSTIQTMLKVADKEDSKPLKAAAEILNQFIFGTKEITPPSRLSREDTSEDDGLKREKAEFIREQIKTHSEELYTAASNMIRSNIEANIDPRGRMSPYVKKNATREAFDSLENLIRQDVGFRKSLDRLWDTAMRNRFSRDSKQAIKSSYLSKARALLPEVIKRARIEALKGTGHRVEKDRKGPLSVGRSSSSNERGRDSSGASKSKIAPDMSTLDFFNSD
jgi:hypothetical protein